MGFNQIRIFIAVYRAGNFAAVAKDDNVAPSSISRAIAKLEKDLQTRLFQRTTRKLTPTEAGERYFKRVAPLIEEFDQAHQALIDDLEMPSGTLRVTASVSYGQIIIAPLLKKFRTCFPHIEIELILSDSRLDIISEQIDIALRHGQLADSSLVRRKLCDVQYYLVASPEYLAENTPIGSPGHVRDHVLITMAYENFRKEWSFKSGDNFEKISIHPALTISNAVAVRQCVRDEIGIAVLADWVVEDDLAKGRLARLLPEWQVSGAHFDSSIWLVYPSRRFLPAKTRAFSQFLRDHI